MLWFKRLTALILIAVIISGYFFYKQLATKRKNQEADRYAEVTAQTWIASARFHNDPGRYSACRDSILKAHSLSKEDIENYLNKYKDRPEQYDLFTKLVNQYVDSLYSLETSLPGDGPSIAQDSTE